MAAEWTEEDLAWPFHGNHGDQQYTIDSKVDLLWKAKTVFYIIPYFSVTVGYVSNEAKMKGYGGNETFGKVEISSWNKV